MSMSRRVDLEDADAVPWDQDADDPVPGNRATFLEADRHIVADAANRQSRRGHRSAPLGAATSVAELEARALPQGEPALLALAMVVPVAGLEYGL